MKDIDVLIYFEHVVRELDSCLLIKKNIELHGLTAQVVPVHRNRYFSFIKYRPKIVLVPFLFADNNDIVIKELNLMYGHVLCLNLHHEQFYNEMTKSHFMPKNEISKNAFHLSWGMRFHDDLIESGVSDNKIFVTGNPRTDLYYLSNEPELLSYKQKFKEVIFIPTSFSWAFVDENYFIKNAGIKEDIFREKKSITLKTATIFLTDIRRLARKYPNKLFVVRPHPFEEITTYIDFLKKLDLDNELENNIIIRREYSVYDWIRISDLVIGWITTVSMEASMFRKKNVIYTPIQLDDSTKTDFMDLYDEIITDYYRLESIVGDIDSYRCENKLVMEYLSVSMGIADGKVCERIASCINSIPNLHSQERKVNLSRYFYNTMKSVFIDLPKNILYSLGLLRYVRPLYKGILEDMLSYRQISNYNKKFFNRLNYDNKDKFF